MPSPARYLSEAMKRSSSASLTARSVVWSLTSAVLRFLQALITSERALSMSDLSASSRRSTSSLASSTLLLVILLSKIFQLAETPAAALEMGSQSFERAFNPVEAEALTEGL